MKKEKLIKYAEKGLLALVELKISHLENSNKELIRIFDEDEKALPEIDKNLHATIGRDYDSLFKMYTDFEFDLNPISEFTSRYREAKRERLTILLVYQDRKGGFFE